MTRSSLSDKVAKAIEQYDMLSGCRCVAVGLSGGADSSALLHCLCQLAGRFNYEVRAIHVNHCIRGAEADADERFARELCCKMGIELDCFTVDVPKLARERRLGLEECGRVCRYECFSEVSVRYGCKIATAHTLSDSAETLLFNITRGCGVTGLCGIPAVRGSVIRPLIFCTRDDVEQYCAQVGLSFVTDSTNADASYSRNRIRLEVVPALQRINPAFHEAAARLMTCAAQDEEYLSAVAAKAAEQARMDGGWRTEMIANLPPAVRKRIIIIIIAGAAGMVPEYRHVELADEYICAGSGAVELSAGCRLRVNAGVVSISNEAPATGGRSYWECRLTELLWASSGREHEKDARERDAEICANISLPDGRFVHLCVTEVVQYDESLKKSKLLFKNCLDYDIITNNTFLRFRRDGDRFKPSGSTHTKRVKKLLCDSGVPLGLRDGLLMIANNERLLWLEGFGVSEECRVSAQTKRVLSVTIDDTLGLHE